MSFNPKLSFGSDLYILMKTLELQGSEKRSFDPLQDATESLFISLWDFSIEEINEIHVIFEKNIDDGKMPDIRETMERLLTNIKTDQNAVNRLLIQSLAIAFLGDQVDKPLQFLKTFGEQLGVKPLQMEDYIKKGFDLASQIKFIGMTYSKYKSQ